MERQKELEQHEMQVNDYQSYLANQNVPLEDITILLRKDAEYAASDSHQDYVKQLQKAMRSLKLDVKHYKTQYSHAQRENQGLQTSLVQT